MIEYNYDPDDYVPKHFIGLDLGQTQDPTALVVVERSGAPEPYGGGLRGTPPPDIRDADCTIPAIRRYPLGTPYPTIVEDVASNLSRSPEGTKLIIDGTGVGQAVVDLFRDHPLLASRRSQIVPVTITAGDQESYENGYRRVPKRNLVGAIQVLLQTQRLKIADNLPETPTLVAELQNFKVKISAAANDQYGEWRAGQHDDLVLAAALACWAAHHSGINSKFRVGYFSRW